MGRIEIVATVTGANFTGASLVGGRLGFSQNSMNFTNADMTGFDFDGRSLGAVNLTGATLTNAEIDFATFSSPIGTTGAHPMPRTTTAWHADPRRRPVGASTSPLAATP
ncbi:MAG: pentapeptide repeat-containing protein [Acidimicrobiales bacterium]